MWHLGTMAVMLGFQVMQQHKTTHTTNGHNGGILTDKGATGHFNIVHWLTPGDFTCQRD